MRTKSNFGSEEEVKQFVLEKTYEAIVRYLNRDRDKHKPSNDIIYVTELAKDCPRSVFFGRVFGNYFLQLKDIVMLCLGELVHSVPILENGHEVEIEWEGIRGRIDEYDEELGIMIEKKTTRKLPSSPYPHHVKQLQIYAFMLSKLGKPLRYMFLWYFDLTNPDDPVRVFRVEPQFGLSMEQELLTRRDALVFALKSGRIPPRHIGWFCRYCKYAHMCFMSDDDIQRLVGVAKQTNFGYLLYGEYE